MTSDDSDDEPLSVLASAKKANPEKFIYEPKKKKKRAATQVSPYKKLPLTFNFSRKLQNAVNVVQRPADVWLYLKDFTPMGPYSCLLCPEWFINKAKVVVHYILNHKKDYCGICRYFVPDREAWLAHNKFHTPWRCSQCTDGFDTQLQLRIHLSQAHNLVHCRLCHFRVNDNEQYHKHLLQKHNIPNVICIADDFFWELDYEGSPHFFCKLCGKANNPYSTFVNHFMAFHHFTLKCLTAILSGSDLQVTVVGADVSPEFMETLNKQKRGYKSLDISPNKTEAEIANAERDQNILNELLLEVKQEVSDSEDVKPNEEESPAQEEESRDLSELVRTYRGDEDFDVTLMEIIILQKCFFDYVNQMINDIKSSQMPEISDVNYEHAKSDIIMDVDCSLCQTRQHTAQNLMTHMNRCHSVKSLPIFSCRVCATTFDTQNELDSHVAEELGDFDDLWICQFCDKEFDNRQASRRHLTEHWDLLEYDNCFSPHLGFKCKFCPTLFWNETDRESHQVRVHFSRYKEYYYQCKSDNCSEMFSEKIWFMHHYLDKHLKQEECKGLYLIKCCLCCIVLPSVEEMRAHFGKEHPDARKVFCSLDGCKYRPLSHKKSFQLHLRSQHGTVDRMTRSAVCGQCGREFPTGRACAAHVAQVHTQPRFSCKLCGHMLHSIDERKLHYLIKHPGQHPYECKICGKSFQCKSSLYVHKKEHAPNKQSFTCSYCQKVFEKKDSFREHLRIHEGPHHACSYCPMRFVQRSNMLRHERRHTGERPYACPHCERTFADKGACNSHVRAHSKTNNFACPFCGQTFAQKSKLTYHIRKHTGENLETCKLCSKIFTSGCALREHMKAHDPKKDQVACPLCDRKYQDERYMLRHLRTSHSFVRYSCPICDKTLSSAAGLRHHVVTHSDLNVFRCKRCNKSSAVKRTMVKHLRKRHGLKSGDVNIKDYYTKLDPSECELGLDDQTMKSIFGPPRRKLSDYASFPRTSDMKNEPEDNDNDNDNENSTDNEESEAEAESEASEDSIDTEEEDYKDKSNNKKDKAKNKDKAKTAKDKATIRKEKPKLNEGDAFMQTLLEPTDFVTVKIEPFDEDSDMYK